MKNAGLGLGLLGCIAIWGAAAWQPTPAAADILEWQDANGVSHYTNLKSEVPKARRDSAQVIVDEAARQPQPPVPATADDSAPSSEANATPRQAQVVYDRSGATSRAYLEGLQRGLELGGVLNTGGSVSLNGPLALANASGPAPYYDYLPPLSYPLVTTSFDRGRSRHMTLRMLLEDQFALDQEGPFIYDQRFLPPFGHVPLGVALSPFLPRGLPHGFPEDLRVITR